MEGIEAKIDGASAITDIIGTDRFFDKASEDVGTEYIVYHIISESPSRQFNGKEIWTFRVQFDMYSRSNRTNPATINTLDAAVTTAFDGQTLTFTGFTNVSTLKDGGQPINEENIWRFSQDYIITAQID